MNEKMILVIPDELSSPFFFSAGEPLIVEKDSLKNLNLSIPFLYEAAFFSGMDAIKPWLMQEECIPLLLKEWQAEKLILEELFAKRDRKQAAAPMKKGISLFLELVYWTNGEPAKLSSTLEFDKLKNKPVNLKERLNFILDRPALYHAFMQLTELMTEMEKQYMKQLALKKASKLQA
ncbi:hypothetical protein BGM26_08705 [Bacillus sp. FJAT-29790]|uniref:YpoC family protein n=1 Tax=Bacillus sp. FJAT-29790 TaxID=1895002 RepID=UPI001C22F4C1|nr:hypothetical protein [Bacillus sp. FJAT-29790]MBU8879062.1 hypothetical protein [Bacillus sp. FJAT-29790]